MTDNVLETKSHAERSEDVAVALFGELLMVEQLARSRITKALPKGMELSHFSILNHLARLNEERSPAQLARAFHVTRGAMTNTLTRLEKAGHIHVRPDWDDARRKFVAISPAGRAARAVAVRAVAPLIVEATRAIGIERARTIIPVLRELRASLYASAPPSAPPPPRQLKK